MVRPLLSSMVMLSLASFSCDLSSPLHSTTAPRAEGAGEPQLVAAVSAPPPAPIRASREEPKPPAVAEVTTVAAYLAQHETGLSRGELDLLARTIVEESRARNFEPWLVLAGMRVESAFDNFAVSSAGAFGLMQIQAPTGRELAARLGLHWNGTQSLFDPTVNVKLGVAYLEELRERFGDIRTALAAYNWGPGRINRRIRHGRAVPAGYSKRVLDDYTEFTVTRHHAF